MKQLPNPYKLHEKNVISEKETEAQASYVAAQSLTELGAALQGDSSLGLSSSMAIHGRSWTHTAPGLGGILSFPKQDALESLIPGTSKLQCEEPCARSFSSC